MSQKSKNQIAFKKDVETFEEDDQQTVKIIGDAMQKAANKLEGFVEELIAGRAKKKEAEEDGEKEEKEMERLDKEIEELVKERREVTGRFDDAKRRCDKADDTIKEGEEVQNKILAHFSRFGWNNCERADKKLKKK